MTWQLIAHPDEQICGVLFHSVQKALRQHEVPATVDMVLNLREAVESIGQRTEEALDLVVIASKMPSDEAASVGLTGRDPTLDFIRDLKQRRADLPLIVVANTPDDRLAGFLSAFDQTGIVTVGSDLGRTMVDRVKVLYLPSAGRGAARSVEAARVAAREDAWVELNIHLGGDRFGAWDMRRTGNVEFEDGGHLQVDGKLLKRLIKHSQQLNEAVAIDSATWLESVDELSDDLRKLLFRNGDPNIDCWDRFLKQREQVGGVASSRICITVNDETHSMLFEALRDSDMRSDESWILNAPVFRRYAQQMKFPPLFVDAASREGPRNCLVIEAHGGQGRVPIGADGEEDFAWLELLPEEASVVTRLLAGVAGNVVVPLKIGPHDASPTETVLAKLAERQWHIVHFCGHVGGAAASPSLVLRATPDGLLPIQSMTRALSRTQLLVLSSCRSAQTQIVMHAVERSVSALLGFQWVIEDRAALEFSTDFYRLLFDAESPRTHRLEHALLEARKEAYRRRPAHPSWMAPVLVMQMG